MTTTIHALSCFLFPNFALEEAFRKVVHTSQYVGGDIGKEGRIVEARLTREVMHWLHHAESYPEMEYLDPI